MKRVSVALVSTLATACVPDSGGFGRATETTTTTAATNAETTATAAETTAAAATDATGATGMASSTGTAATETGDPDSSSSGETTGEPALSVAGELIVDLDAEHPSAGSPMWANQGTGSDFMQVGTPMLVTRGGHMGIEVSGGPSIYVSEQNAPPSVTGLDATRTVEVWAWNGQVANEESMVAWGVRADPPGSNVSFNFGNNDEFGAVTHWGSDPDLNWMVVPTSGAWHYLVYTYDGTTTRVYVDGMLDNTKELGPGVLDTVSGTPFVIGAQNNSMGTFSIVGSLVLARIRVHSEALDADGVAANYALEQGEF